jgi:hypothetical protein
MQARKTGYIGRLPIKAQMAPQANSNILQICMNFLHKNWLRLEEKICFGYTWRA